MKEFDYKRMFLAKGILPSQYFEEEVNRLLSYHSYSPQYKFYSDFLIGGLNSCVYKNLLSVEDTKRLMNKIENHRDTISSGATTSIMFFFDRYKPRLGVIDLLFDIDIDRTYMLKVMSNKMQKSFDFYSDFGFLFDRRRELIIENLQKALELKDSAERESYYYLFFAKRLLLVSSCYYRGGECDDLVDVYIDIAKEVYKVDSNFYSRFVDFYRLIEEEEGEGEEEEEKSSDGKGELILDPRMIFEDRLSDRDSMSKDYSIDNSINKYSINKSSVFNNPSDVRNPSNGEDLLALSKYSYMDFLLDFDEYFKSMTSYKYVSNINKYVNRISKSELPKELKNKFITSMYNLEIEFNSEDFEITEAFLWFDFVGEDFPSFLKLKCYNESKVVINTLTSLLTEDKLVEFYVNKAYMYAFADGDNDVYNYVLLDNLKKLKEYNFISDIDYYYNKHRR